MKIYFAGSISGGRDFAENYSKIIKLLKVDNIVLTEHVGDLKLTNLGENLSEAEIYERDCRWIRESDIVFAEISTPSLGVGYEIGYAESLNKKIICVYKKSSNKRVSGMILGNKNIISIEYKNMKDIKQILIDYIRN